jgi:hypothetical protein
MTLPIITPEMLHAAGAKCKVVDRLAKRWPNGAKPTLRNLVAVQKLGAKLSWFTWKFLTPEARDKYLATQAKALSTAIRKHGINKEMPR